MHAHLSLAQELDIHSLNTCHRHHSLYALLFAPLIENKEKERERERDKDSTYFSPPSGQTKVLAPPSPPNPNYQIHQYQYNNNNGTAPGSTFQSGRSVSPTTSERDPSKCGLLVIRVVEARGLTLPTGFDSTTLQKNHPHYGSPTNSSRESLQRKWWLPYAVLEFDKNEILIDALGGEMSNPVWQYRAHL
jgi:serum/glucocorticoid-regulated kinase 2